MVLVVREVSWASLPKISKLNLFLMVVAKVLSGDLMIIPLRVGIIWWIASRGTYFMNCWKGCFGVWNLVSNFVRRKEWRGAVEAASFASWSDYVMFICCSWLESESEALSVCDLLLGGDLPLPEWRDGGVRDLVRDSWSVLCLCLGIAPWDGDFGVTMDEVCMTIFGNWCVPDFGGFGMLMSWKLYENDDQSLYIDCKNLYIWNSLAPFDTEKCRVSYNGCMRTALFCMSAIQSHR